MHVIPAWSEILEEKKKFRKRMTLKMLTTFGVLLTGIMTYMIPLVGKEIQISRIDLEGSEFHANETVNIDIGSFEPDDIEVVLENTEGTVIVSKEDVTIEDKKIKISANTDFHPGKNKIKLVEGTRTIFEEDFTWGVLAINFNKSIYKPSEDSKIHMAVLDENGEMICDANVVLTIESPVGAVHTLSTKENDIKVNPQCNLKTPSLIPDYETSFYFEHPGEYKVTLDAETANGNHSINDKILVAEGLEYDIERISATRIFPPNQYPMILKVRFSRDFTGQIVETVPASFKVYQYETSDLEFGLEIKEKIKTLTWEVDAKEGEEIVLGYSYLAPRISPDLHLLGYVEVYESSSIVEQGLDGEPLIDKLLKEEEIIESTESTKTQSFLDKIFISFQNFSQVRAQLIDELIDDRENEESTQANIVEDNIISSPTLDDKEEISQTGTVVQELELVFTENRKWQIAADAFGDFAIYRMNATGPQLSRTVPTDVEWDTTVADTSSTFTLQGNNSDIDLGENGHYLVLYNLFTEDFSGDERRTSLSWLSIGSVEIPYGRASSYIRDSGGALEGYSSGAAIIEANAGDDLQLHVIREDTDDNGESNLRGGTNGISVIKLYDGWDYFRAYLATRSADISGNTTFTPVSFDTQDELDTGSFDHSETVNPENITLKGAAGKHFLVTANVKFNQDANSQNRQNYEMMLSLDGSEIDDTRVSTYLRGNPNTDGNFDMTTSYVGIITKTASADQTLNVEVRRESQGSASTDIVNDQTGITIVALPDDAHYIRLSDTTGTQDLSTSRTSITWNQTDEEDIGSFDHDSTNTERVNIELADDYLFFGTLYAAKNSTTDGTRETVRGDWRINGSSLIQYGGFGAFVRGDQSTTDSYTGGASGGLLINGLTTSDYVELTQINEAANSTATYQDSRMGLQGISLSTLFDNIPLTTQLHFRWRDDTTSLNTSGGWLDSEDTTVAIDQNNITRLRLSVANPGTGTELSARTYELQFANKGVQASCSTVTGWVGIEDSGSDSFEMVGSTNISPDGQATSALLTNSESYTFVSGEGRDVIDTTGSIGALAENEYTELEYSIQATSNSTKGDTYCFRVFDTTAASTIDVYSTYPELIINNPDIRQLHFRWRDDSTDLNTVGGWLASEDSNVIGDISKNTTYRIRLSSANEGTSAPASGKQYELQFADKTGHATCAVADNWVGLSDSGSDEFALGDSANIDPDGESTTSGLLANSEGYSYIFGEGKDSSDTTSTIGPLDAGDYTEVEYSIEATTGATNGTSYCFRLYNNLAGAVLDNYDVYPEATVLAPPAVGGEIAIYREATAGEDIPYSTLDMTWDTTVQEDGVYTLQANDSDIDLGDDGHYLVLYNIFTDLGSDGGTNRREVVSWLSLGGTPIPYGYSYGYVRDTASADEAYNASGAIIEASSGDDLQAHIVRTDTNTTPAVGLRSGTSGINILKLNDSWDYLRAYLSTRSSDISGNTSFTDIDFDTNDEVDTGSFEHSETVNPDEITLKGASGKHFLVTANVRLNQDASSTTRQNYEMRLALGGVEIDGTRVSGYLRGNNNTDGIYNTALNYSGIITKTASSDQILTVQLRRESLVGVSTDIVDNETSISIVALPDSPDYIRLTNQTGGYSLSTSRTAFDWDNILEEDTTSLDLDGTTISRININTTDDYLFFSSIYNAGATTTNREQPRLDFRIDGSTIQGYGGHGSYNRNDSGTQASLTSGSSHGLILLNLADTSYVELTQINEATDQGATYQADRLALQGVNLTSLFSALPTTNQLHYRWRDDTTDLNTSGGWLASEDANPGTFTFETTYRLRFEVANTGDAVQALSKNYQIQFADKTGHATCAVADGWTGIDDVPNDDFDMVGSSNIDPDGEATTSGLLANSEAYTFVNGEGRDVDDSTSSLGPLATSEYTEVEYSFEATTNATELNTYCLRLYDASLGTEIDSYSVYPEFTTPTNPNANPDDPTNLVQRRVTAGTSINTGDWTDETQVTFEADVSDTDNPEQIRLCVEYRALGNAFTDVEDQCGSYASYSGSAVTASVTVTGLNDDLEYHWHVRAQDDDGAYSNWVAYGGNPENESDFGIDSTPPTGGSVYDGSVSEIDQDFSTTALDSLSANWGDFDASASGLSHYEYSIGTTQGGTDVVNWINHGTSTSATESGLNLQTSQIYYFNVRAVDNAGNIQNPVSSDGQMITPALTFSISPSSVSFDNLNSANNYTDTKTTTLTTTTNAYNGYVVRAYITDLLTSADSANTIQNFDGGTYASPDSWLSGDRGFGFTSSDTSIQGSDKFNGSPCAGGGSPPCYAPFSLSAPGDIVADHTSNVSGTIINNEQFVITYRVQTDSSQEASEYTTTVVYTITAVY